MYYTIASLESPHTGDRLDINKNGNKYIVYLTHKDEDSGEPYSLHAHREFDSLNDAYKVFEKLSSWIIYGFYDFYHRREYLLTGTMKGR